MSRHLPRSVVVTALVVSLIPASLCCSDNSGGDPSATIVKINGQEITYRQFAGYLEANLGAEIPTVHESETRSRLLDLFIEEQLLLQAARSRRIEVSEEMINTYLAGLGVGESGVPAGEPQDTSLREQVRRNLEIQEYKDQVLLRDVQVGPEEVEDYYREHRNEFHEPRAVVMRQILLDERSRAEEVLATLREEPSRFPDLAGEVSLSPDRGALRSYREEELPESVREVVFSLRPGQISEVLGQGGEFRILQVMERQSETKQSLEEAGAGIEVLILRRKAEEALTRALSELRQASEITIIPENLPFPYAGEYPGESR